MLWHPFLLLVRRRLIATAIFSLLVAILAARIDDVGTVFIFDNVGTLFFFVSIFLGVFLGWTGPDKGTAEMRFLLTRPIPRLAAFLRPLAIAASIAALFPIVTFLLMLGLRYLAPHPARLHVLATVDLWGQYRLDVQSSLVGYATIALGRWEAFSPKWIRSLVSWSGLLLLGLIFWLRPWRLSRGAGLEYSLLSIIFIVWASGTLYGAWRVLQSVDELPEPGHLTRGYGGKDASAARGSGSMMSSAGSRLPKLGCSRTQVCA